MNCKEIHSKLIFFLDGELTDKEAEIIREHLSECPLCTKFLYDLKETLQLIVTDRYPEIEPYFYTRLQSRLEDQTSNFTSTATYSVWESFLKPALFSLLLLCGSYIGIKVGQTADRSRDMTIVAKSELSSVINEMESEPIESFLME